jgi:STE24 endopeptidase
MPAGPLNEELAKVCQDMRLRFRRLLIWRTGGMIANALVMGLLAPVRYVLLSDALLEQLDRREVRAVFAHEAGHIVGHHLFYMLLFSISSMTLCKSAGELLAWRLRLDGWWAEGIVVGLLGAAWLLGFGWISRRFERQSDVVSAWYCGDSGPSPDGRISPEGACAMARSLERIAQLNGIPQGQWNWRHGSIRGRVAYVMWLGSTAGDRDDADRPVRRIKAGLWAATALSAAIIAMQAAIGF